MSDVTAPGCHEGVQEIGTFYIASSRDGLADVEKLSMYLMSRGMRNAFPWPVHFAHRCSGATCGIRDRIDLARRELVAASKCDLFIGVARLGKGSHVELGAALAGQTKRIILAGVDREDSLFYARGVVEVVATVDDVVRALEVRATPADALTADYLVTVCAACRRASCWHGELMCERARDAGTVDVRASVLRAENREHPDNLSTTKLQSTCGSVRYVA